MVVVANAEVGLISVPFGVQSVEKANVGEVGSVRGCHDDNVCSI